MPAVRMLPERIDPQTATAAAKPPLHRLELIEHADWPVALHSVNLTEHAWKRMTEIDFLLIGRRGLFLIEVKGGDVSFDGAVWTHTNRYGRAQRKRSSPFSQARSAMFALEARLEKH